MDRGIRPHQKGRGRPRAEEDEGWLYVPSASEVSEALRLSQELELQIVLGANIDEAVAKLNRFGKAVILDATIEYRELDEETQKQKKICSAKMLADAGVPFALTLGSNGPDELPMVAARHLRPQRHRSPPGARSTDRDSRADPRPRRSTRLGRGRQARQSADPDR